MKANFSNKIRKKIIISTFIILIIEMLIVSGTFLSYYGRIETTVNIEPSVQIKAGGETDWHDYSESPNTFDVPISGKSFCFKFWLRNQASVPAPIEFRIAQIYEGVTAAVYKFPTIWTTLELSSKNSTQNPDNRMSATLTFNPVAPTFDYTLTNVAGLAPSTEYALIYYSDKNPIFEQWNGNGGLVITMFNSDEIPSGAQSVNFNRNIPDGADWNIHPEAIYQGAPYNYTHWQGGAKLLIVPTADLTGQNSLPLTAWHQDQYLFETDLISYSDCNLQVVPWTMSFWSEEVTDAKIPPNTEMLFFVCYSFDFGTMPGTYTINTYVTANFKGEYKK